MIESGLDDIAHDQLAQAALSPSSRSAATRNARQRRAQVVRDAEQHRPQLLVGRVAPARHRAQGVAEPLDLARAADPALGSSPRPMAVDLPDQARHRRGNPAAHQRGDDETTTGQPCRARASRRRR
jgi:hypothetical protein